MKSTPQEPEDLPAQWGFVWSTDPDKALPFLSLSTSPYAKGDCCTADGKTWRSKIDTNTWSPETNPEFWEEVEPLTNHPTQREEGCYAHGQVYL